jgi:hypothetical protein
MKKSKLFLLVTLITGMEFGLVLAGCATDSGGGPSAEELADQLAEEINALKEGSATVTGATVTLTAGLTPSNLIVPAGVTLDVTAHDAAIMLRDAKLTVNGTVNTAIDFGSTPSGNTWEAPSIRLEDRASWGTINGSGTIYQKGKGNLLYVSGNRTLTLDGVTLVGVADNNNPLVQVNEGGEFVMKSGAITGNTRVSGQWPGSGGVNVYKGTFIMEGGTISGNTVQGGEGASGGGIEVGEGSIFTMKSGAISGNTAEGGKGGEGGGVSVDDKGTFIMEGGTISGNTVQGGEWSIGGGVRLGGGSVFTLEGGTISSNTAGSGGGVGLNDGSTFTMEGGTISGNTARSGGGVQVSGEGTTFTLKGGTIYGSSAGDGNANTTTPSNNSAALGVGGDNSSAKWGTGGTYTKGGVSQTGGSDIGRTDETLIAIQHSHRTEGSNDPTVRVSQG